MISTLQARSLQSSLRKWSWFWAKKTESLRKSLASHFPQVNVNIKSSIDRFWSLRTGSFSFPHCHLQLARNLQQVHYLTLTHVREFTADFTDVDMNAPCSFHHVHGQSRKRNQEFLFHGQGVDLEVNFLMLTLCQQLHSLSVCWLYLRHSPGVTQVPTLSHTLSPSSKSDPGRCNFSFAFVCLKKSQWSKRVCLILAWTTALLNQAQVQLEPPSSEGEPPDNLRLLWASQLASAGTQSRLGLQPPALSAPENHTTSSHPSRSGAVAKCMNPRKNRLRTHFNGQNLRACMSVGVNS